MKPHEALEFLDGVLQQVNTNRATHVRIQQAVDVLARALAPIERTSMVPGLPEAQQKSAESA